MTTIFSRGKRGDLRREIFLYRLSGGKRKVVKKAYKVAETLDESLVGNTCRAADVCLAVGEIERRKQEAMTSQSTISNLFACARFISMDDIERDSIYAVMRATDGPDSLERYERISRDLEMYRDQQRQRRLEEMRRENG